jgi:predicted Zn-dependent protease
MKLLHAFMMVSVAVCFMGCAALEQATQVVTSAASTAGLISEDQKESVDKVSTASVKALEDFTPENEYFIGRSVAASVLKSYRVYDNKQVNEYLNTLGQALAAASDKPEVYKGYRFAAMDTDEVNAFATPGGFILVSRGLLRNCKNEDALAAVLAHEVGHVQLGHGMATISKGRKTDALKIIALEAGKNLAGDDIAELTEIFEGSVDDMVNTMKSGYGRKDELAADQVAVTVMKRLGYNPNGLKDMLEEMCQHMDPKDAGFGKSHPDPKDRIKAIQPAIGSTGPVVEPTARQARFDKVMAGI